MLTPARGTVLRLALLTSAAGALVPVTAALAGHAASSSPAAAASSSVATKAGSSAVSRALSTARTAGSSVRLAKVGSAAGTAKGLSQPAATDPDAKPVIVGATLDLFRFGAGIGAPLVCQAATSGMGSGANELGIATQAAPVIQAINDGCDTFATQGVAAVDRFAKAAQPLNALNEPVNPMIETGAKAVEDFGSTYGEEISPLGPTVVGSGATIRHFEGR